MNDFNLDVIAAPSESVIVGFAACAGMHCLSESIILTLADSLFDRGFPIATVPLGASNASGQPFGLFVVAKSHQEHTLLRFMHAFEASFPPRKVPSGLCAP